MCDCVFSSIISCLGAGMEDMENLIYLGLRFIQAGIMEGEARELRLYVKK